MGGRGAANGKILTVSLFNFKIIIWLGHDCGSEYTHKKSDVNKQKNKNTRQWCRNIENSSTISFYWIFMSNCFHGFKSTAKFYKFYYHALEWETFFSYFVHFFSLNNFRTVKGPGSSVEVCVLIHMLVTVGQLRQLTMWLSGFEWSVYHSTRSYT